MMEDNLELPAFERPAADDAFATGGADVGRRSGRQIPMPIATDTDTSQLVVCALGGEEYGLPVGQVREIVRYSEPRPVASDVPWMRGVISLRGRLVPVHDLGVRLGLSFADADAAPPPSAKLVIVETTDEPVGVLVDDVVEVLTIS